MKKKTIVTHQTDNKINGGLNWLNLVSSFGKEIKQRMP